MACRWCHRVEEVRRARPRGIDENLTHYKQQIPALFWFNALLIASNARTFTVKNAYNCSSMFTKTISRRRKHLLHSGVIGIR